MTWTKVIQVRGRKDIASRAQELAQIFAPVSPTTTKEWIEQTLGESQDEDTVLLTLRQEEFRKIQEQLRTFEEFPLWSRASLKRVQNS